MVRDAVAIIMEFFHKFIVGVKTPELDSSLPDPDLLREEAARYE